MKRATPVYDSASKLSVGLEEVRQVVRYRDLVYQLVRRDILTRYKRSVLGVAWTMLNPLGTMVVLALAFSQLFRGTPGYAAYVLSGLIVWSFFSQTTTAAMYSIIWGSSLIHRIYLPRTVFAISSVTTGMVNLTLSLVPMVIVMLIVRVPLRLTALFLPISLAQSFAYVEGRHRLEIEWAVLVLSAVGATVIGSAVRRRLGAQGSATPRGASTST